MGDTQTGFYSATYQSLNGSNYTIIGPEKELLKDNNKKLSFFCGFGTNFSDNNQIVCDLKGSMNYNSVLNQNVRLRTKIGNSDKSIQLRYSPVSINVPVGNDISIYANPHCTINTSAGDVKISAGTFAGATKKLNDNISVSAEVQRYNLQNLSDNNPSNWGINATISYKF